VDRLVTTAVESDRREMVALIRDFVDREVAPVVSELEAGDIFPTDLVAKMKALGLFGVTISERYGGLGLDFTTYALIQMELARGWMSLAGVLNTHTMAAWLIGTYGTDEQRDRFLPRMATGELRSAYAISEPQAGSDVQAITTRAVRSGGEFLISGEKLWVTNGLRAGMVLMIAKTDPEAEPRHRGITAFIVEKEPEIADCGTLVVTPPIAKLGYRGVETTGLVFTEHPVPERNLLGGEAGLGRGFAYMMAALEIGRINVAARGVGLATSALEHSLRYAQQREAFGKPIAQHQAIQAKLAEMATNIQAARLLTLDAARRKDAGERVDLEAGMAKLFATETAQSAALEALRIHGGFGYSKEFPVERLYRDAPLLIVGEGTNEIQKLVIARRLLERDAARTSA
jgi:alkylation response protein AidB-like acyl-CoA dehydrogenase